ncbi:MAG: chitobiase/beta-hexosaminidase C-terminal domain-containing protein [Fimbriimonadaceae bacterium]|nr:chitobiase/beta-hexosaminidase C-terminal domain-containing protein [Fimbriimonadaceae bacterium]QYK55651.1 MAG: chitobiase/beta-hexosaminidase C-terminal domain-containing protein [Fimbriimonadaceae bacterium]
MTLILAALALSNPRPAPADLKIVADAPIFLDSLQVKIEGGKDVRYTTDGTEPTARSPRYSGPITLKDTAKVTAASFGNGKAAPVSESFSKVLPWAAAKPRRSEPGVALLRFAGEFSSVRDFYGTRRPPAEAVQTFGLPEKGTTATGLVYEAFLDVDETAVYSFWLGSSEGSRLFIEGQMVIDNDGTSGHARKQGFAPLAKGLHSVRLEWFNRSGTPVLDLRMGLPGKDGQPIPQNKLMRTPIRQRPGGGS